jgi:putative sterol carrier protein
VAASFVIVAPYALWKTVIRGELDPTKGMMQGRLKLTKGHMPTMVKYVTASKELVASTSRVPTKFRDE